MNMSRLAWAGGAAAVLLLLLVAYGWHLKQRYCWDCTAPERYAQATGLLCDRDVEERRRGLDILHELADQGLAAPQQLLGGLYLQPFPERFIPLQRELLACVRSEVPADPALALVFFQRLAETAPLSPELTYDLGVLVDEGLLQPSGKVRSAREYFQQAAEDGNPQAMVELGLERDKQRQYADAARWFTEAFSRGGVPVAALKLGDYALYGREKSADVAEALDWYQKALATAECAGAKGVVMQAQSRLAIARDTQQRRGEDIPEIRYRLGGDFDEYRIYLDGDSEPLGRVFRKDDGFRARYRFAGATQEGPREQAVASMNDGLSWVLSTHAAGLYGAEQQVRFVLAGE